MTRSTETSSFKFNHTMIRVKDIDASLQFYTQVLGMEVISEHHNEEAKFSLYFLAFDHSKGKDSKEEKEKGKMNREGELRTTSAISPFTWLILGVLELTHNHGTEVDNDFKGYVSGNEEPYRGFGHLAISVDDIDKACERFESMGVKFKKRSTDGKMRHIAFILDPDGYWIEVVPQKMDL